MVQRTLSNDKIFEKPSLQMFPAPDQELNARPRPHPALGARPVRDLAGHRGRRARPRSATSVTTGHLRRCRCRSTAVCSRGTRRGTATSRTAGYNGVAAEGLRFFPLFPLLGRAVSWLPGCVGRVRCRVRRERRPRSRSGSRVHALVMHERDDRELARRAVWLVYLVPPAFVLVMGYAEATFMTLAALVAARSAGAALVARGALRFARRADPAGRGPARGARRGRGLAAARRRRPSRRSSRRCVGLLAYLGVGRAPHARLLVSAARAGGPDPARHWVDPIRAVAHNVHELFAGDHVSAGMHAVSAIVFVALLVVIARRWPLSFTLYAAVALVVALSSRNLDSLERYGLATLPFVLGGRRRDRGTRDRTRRPVPRRRRPRRRLDPGVHRGARALSERAVAGARIHARR